MSTFLPLEKILRRVSEHWLLSRDGDFEALRIFKRHYTYRPVRNRRTDSHLFVGPGEKLVLIGVVPKSLFVWRKEHFSKRGDYGINCAVFRNESPVLSSILILEAAEQIAWQRWPGERLYTYVNARKIRSSNPGYCFLRAGWKRIGVTVKRKLFVLEKNP